MADEPRRSVRATKGQHTKKDDEMNTPEPPKKRSKKAIKKQEPEQEVEIIRCVCGATETQDNDEEPWIACDNCEAWQHNVCMGISTFDEDVPDSYLCEQCSPQSHQVLVNALQKGVKIWEDRRRAYEKSQEKEKPKKGGKKGKAKRTSDLKLEGNGGANGKAKSPASSARGSHPPPDKKEKKETPAKSSGTKRRRDESHETDSAKAAKIAKVTSAAPPPLPPTPTPAPPPPPQSPPSLVKITDLENQRQQVANYFLKFLQDSIPRAIKLSGLALKDGDTTESKAERLAVEIEDAVYKSHPNPMQRAKILALNLKRNLELTSGLLAKTLTPATLAIMSEDDLAPEELKRKNAELKAQNDKQSIMITDEGPRIRRTHKGEEILEVDDYVAPADDTTATSRRRSELDPNGEMAVRSRENSPGDGVELPDNIDEYRSQDNIRKNVTPKEPLKVNTKPTKPAVRKQSSTQDFDINKVFSSVQSPVGVQHARKPSIAGNAPPINGPGEDPEIDAMLEDDGNESPPYSPQEYNSDPEIVWRGSVRMDTVAQFPASAKHVGGNDLGPSPFSWSDILPKDVKVGGRISEETANEYLCGLRYSPNSDLVVVSITPSGETATQEFKKLFDYFQEKSKWGVVLAKSQGNVRDTYIVPVPPNPAMLPDFMENLESHKLSGDRSEEMILLAIVIRNQPEHLHNSIADGSSDPRSPSLMSHPQRQMSISGMGPSVSPIAPQGAFASPSQQQQQPQTPVPQRISRTPEELHRQQEQEERHRQQQEGEANARRILGPYIDAPTVHFLIPQAWQMRALEWEVIRDIFKSDPRAQQDLTHLSQLLEIREGGRGGS